MEVVLGNHVEKEPVESVNGDGIADRLVQSELLVSQLRAALQERDALLQRKETQLQEEARTHDAKMSKTKLQAKARISALFARTESLRHLKSSSFSDEAECQVSNQGSVKRGKLLLLQHRVAELETALVKEQQKQQKQDEQGSNASGQVQDLQRQVQALQEAVCEKDEIIQGRMCIIELLQDQLGEMSAAVGSDGDPLGLRQSNNRLRQKVLALETALQHREERHRQEVFAITARNDAANDFQQLLKSLKQNLHEKEEVLVARTHVVEILQAELDQRDAIIAELQESGRRAHEQKNLSLYQTEPEKLVLATCLQNSIAEQAQLDKPAGHYPASGEGYIGNLPLRPSPASQEQEALLRRIQELEVGLREREEEAAKSEARFLQTKAWSKTRIRQLEDELRKLRIDSSAVELPTLKSRVSELEEELSRYTDVHAHNEELASRLHVFEELERVMQFDLEQAVLHNSAQDGEKDVHRIISQESVVSGAGGSMDEREGLIEDDWLFPGYSEHPAFAGGASGAKKGHASRSLVKAEDETGGQLVSDGRLVATCEARSLLSRKVSLLAEGESLGDLWDDYSINHAASNPSQGHEPSPEYPLMCDTPAVRGLRSVVGDLELERNQLQQQIQELEEGLDEMETRQSLQARTNGLQAEVERLQSQLSQLRSEKSQDEESHHSAMSNLCDRISILVEENAHLQGALQEKEHALKSESARAAHVQATEASLAEAVAALAALSAKFSLAETQLQEAAVRRNASEAECSELRMTLDDLNKQLALKMTKVQLLDEQVSSARAESEQLSEDLERLNLSFKEERARLIATLQEREREADRLQEVEAEAEASTRQGDVTEPPERVTRFPDSRPLAHGRPAQTKRFHWDETSAGLERQLGEAREMLAAAVEEASRGKAESARLEGKVAVEVDRGRKTYEQLQETLATLQEKEREMVEMQTELQGKERETSIFKTECANKEQDILALKAELQDKQREIVAMHTKHRDMEKEVLVLTQKFAEREGAIASLNVEHLDKEREITTLKAERDDKQREIVAMHAKHRDVEQEVTMLKQKWEEKERVIASLIQEQLDKQREIMTLQAKHQDKEQEVVAMHAKHRDMEQEVTKLKQKWEEKEHVIASLNLEHLNQEREIATLKAEREDKERKIAEMHTKYQDMEQELTMLKKKWEEKERVIASLNLEHLNQEQEIAAFKAEREDKERGIVIMRAKHQDMEQDLTILKHKLEEKERVVASLNMEQRDKQREIMTLQAKHQDKEQGVVAMHAKHRDMEQELTMLKQKWQENERVIASLNLEHLNQEREITTLKAEREDKERKSVAMHMKHQDMEQALTMFKQKFEEKEQVIASLNLENLSHEREITMLKAEREDKAREILAMHKDNERMIATMNVEAQNIELNIVTLKADGEDKKREILALQSQLGNTEQEMASLKQEIVTLHAQQHKEREIATLLTQRQAKEQEIAKSHLERRDNEKIELLNALCRDKDRALETLLGQLHEKDRKISTLLVTAERGAAALAQKDAELTALARASQLQSRSAAEERALSEREETAAVSRAEKAVPRAAPARQAEDGDRERAALEAQVQGLQRSLQEAQGHYERLRGHALALQQQLTLVANRPCSPPQSSCQADSQYEDVGPPGGRRHKPSLPCEPFAGPQRTVEATSGGVSGQPSAVQHTVVVDWEGGDTDDGDNGSAEHGQWGDEAEALVYDPRQHPLTRQARRMAFCVRRWLRGRARYCSALPHTHSRKSVIAVLYLVAVHLLLVYLLVR